MHVPYCCESFLVSVLKEFPGHWRTVVIEGKACDHDPGKKEMDFILLLQ